MSDVAATKAIEIWWQDEARIGQKNGLVRLWARKGARPRQPADQRYKSVYLFGAICPARGTGAAIMMPKANTRAMQIHLDEISRTVAKRAHAVLLMDRAGWHTTGKLKLPKNITIILLPSRSPELNPVENIWQYLRQNWLSNRVFETYDTILEAGCEAWNKLIAEPETITSIGMRKWAHIVLKATTPGITRRWAERRDALSTTSLRHSCESRNLLALAAGHMTRTMVRERFKRQPIVFVGRRVIGFLLSQE